MITLGRNWPPRALLPALPAGLLAALAFGVGDIVTQLSSAPADRWVGVSLSYTGLILLGPTWFCLALCMMRLRGMEIGRLAHPWIPRIPLVIAMLCIVALHTNPWHGQFLTLLEGRNAYHFFWYVQAAVGYSTGLAALSIYSWMALRGTDARTRRQAARLAFGSAITPGLSALYVLTPEQLPFDPTSIGVAVTCAIIVASIRRQEFSSVSVDSLTEAHDWDADAVVLMDMSGRMTSANLAAQQILGQMAAEPGGDVIAGLAHVLRVPASGNAPPLTDLQDWMLGSAGMHDQLYRMGSQWLRIDAAQVKNLEGLPVGVIVRVRDETELREATEAVVEQAAALEAVFAASGEGICISNSDRTIRYANDRFREILGIDHLRPGARLREAIDEIVTGLCDPESFLAAADAVLVDSSTTIRTSFTTADGRIIDCTSLPLSGGGTIRGRVWRLSDVSEQRRSEEAILSAQKLESLGLMAGGVAHDFNNLLVAVMGNADIALTDIPEGSSVRPLLEDIRRAAERGSDLTTALLSYAGRSRGATESVDLSEITREMVELMRISMPADVAIELDLVPLLPAVHGDPTQLRQVAMNLLINAADSMKPDGGSLQVRTGTKRLDSEALAGLHFSGQAEPGHFVFVRVEDKGHGMDEETRQRIFDPFFTTKSDGRGLGLAATLGVVRAHGGALGLESAFGLGSTFTIYLPAGDHSAPIRFADSDEQDDRWNGSGRILVADDEETVRRVARRILEDAGFEIVEAVDGADMLRCWKEHSGELRAVLLDLTMPVMNGEEALRELRKLEPKIPVLVASGYSSDQLLLEEQGPETDFLAKPYRRGTLLSAIRTLLGE